MFQKLYENTWVLDDQGVRVFLLAGKEKALVIDTGFNGVDIKEKAREVTDLPLELICTHADMDHVAGNAHFNSFYMHPAEACVYHHAGDNRGTIIPVYDGTEIDCGERKVTVLHVPGHTPGSITIWDREQRCLLGGDPIQQNGEIFMFGPYRDMEAYILGLEHLLDFDFELVYPSHADIPVGREVIPQLIEAAKKILDGSVPGEQRNMFGNQVMAYRAAGTVFLCD